MSSCYTAQGGFTFGDVDIAELGLTYAPESKDFYVYSPTQVNIYSQAYDGHPGEYLYGTSLKPKEFTLRCIFEENVESGLMYKVITTFQIGKTAKLVFKRRPWIYYEATVIKVDTSRLLTAHSGVITISMRAAYPFGRSALKYLSETGDQSPLVLENSGFLTYDPSFITNTIVNTTWNTQEWYLYNPGDVKTPVGVNFAGNTGSNIVTISNDTNGDSLGLVGITDALTTSVNKWIAVDGINGKTVLTNGSTSQLAFLYHHQGFLTLEPGRPIRNVLLKHTYDVTSGRRMSSSSPLFNESMIGKYIKVPNKTNVYRITSILDEYTAGIAGVAINNSISWPSTSTSVLCDIFTLNRIIASGKPTVSKLEFNYTPLFF